MHNFFFGGKWLSYFGGRLLQPPEFSIPERDFKNVEILGKDSDEYVDNGRWKNVEFELEVCFLPIFSQMSCRHLALSIIDWLSNSRGYQIFKDTSHPGYYTRAFITNIESIVAELPTLLTTKIKFSREPWWHSEAGQQAHTLADGKLLSLENPENYIAKPKIVIDRVKPTTSQKSTIFTLNINGQTTSFSSASYNQIVIDGEQMQYIGKNSSGSTFLNEFLPPDINPKETVTVTATNISNAEIKFFPNWRRL